MSHEAPDRQWEEMTPEAQLDRYRNMAELNPQVPWVADRSGRLIDFSPRWLELTGLTRDEALADGWTDVPHLDDLPAMLSAWSRSMTTGTPLDIEHRIRVADGSFRWMRTRAFPRSNPAGEIVNWYGFTEDIDGRIRAEAALQASEARYRNVVETAQEGIWIVDADYRTTFVNTRMAQMLGRTRDEMVGGHVKQFMGAEEREAFERRREERVEGRVGQYDSRYRRKDGSELWVIVSASPILDENGCFAGAIALMNDITERKQWENAQSRLAAIVESSEDAIVSKDLNGIVTSWNASAERIYGWKAEEIIGRSKQLVIPSHLPDELSNILRQMRAGNRIEHYETQRIRKDGTIIDVAISVSPVRDRSGLITGAATIVRDITERKQSERELKRKQAEVVALNERLQRAMQETHHRVKNNLQIVSAMIDMQAIEHSGGEAIPLKELDRLGTHVRTLAVVHDLLTRSIREEERDQRVSSVAVVGQLLRLLEQTSGSCHIHSQIAEAELTSKQAVTVSLALNELVYNAMKHATGNIDVTFGARGALAELAVSDDGEGFPDGFDCRTQSHMGLELVRALVEADLNGDVSFENRPTGGACVRVTFPLIESPPQCDRVAPVQGR